MYRYEETPRGAPMVSQGYAFDSRGERGPKRGNTGAGESRAAWGSFEIPTTTDGGWGSMVEEGEIRGPVARGVEEVTKGERFDNVCNTSFQYSSSPYPSQSFNYPRQSSDNPYHSHTSSVRKEFTTNPYSTSSWKSTTSSISKRQSSAGNTARGERGNRKKETAVERRARRKRSENRAQVQLQKQIAKTSRKSEPVAASGNSAPRPRVGKSNLVRVIEEEKREDEREVDKASEEMRVDDDHDGSLHAEDWSTTMGSTDCGGDPMSRTNSQDWSWSRIDVDAEIPGLSTLSRRASGSHVVGLGIDMGCDKLPGSMTGGLIGLGIDMGGGSDSSWTPVTTTRETIDLGEYSPPPHDEYMSPLSILEEQRLRAMALQSLGLARKTRSTLPVVSPLVGLPPRPHVNATDWEQDWSGQMGPPQWGLPTPVVHQVPIHFQHLVPGPSIFAPSFFAPPFLPQYHPLPNLPSAIPNRAGYFNSHFTPPLPPPPPPPGAVIRASTPIHMDRSQREVILEKIQRERVEIQGRQLERIDLADFKMPRTSLVTPPGTADASPELVLGEESMPAAPPLVGWTPRPPSIEKVVDRAVSQTKTRMERSVAASWF